MQKKSAELLERKVGSAGAVYILRSMHVVRNATVERCEWFRLFFFCCNGRVEIVGDAGNKASAVAYHSLNAYECALFFTQASHML